MTCAGISCNLPGGTGPVVAGLGLGLVAKAGASAGAAALAGAASAASMAVARDATRHKTGRVTAGRRPALALVESDTARAACARQFAGFAQAWPRERAASGLVAAP
ncbi:MAG: hypothetical protein L0271_20750 [Gemmatimonadetes bacterium]|nr:hypothetical protein [Gemmatimonadota bacterium]